MNAANWRDIKENLAECLDLPIDERSSFLSKITEDGIRSAVTKLLIAHDESENFIEKPLLIERGDAEDESIDKLIGTKVDEYLIIEKIGSGGMGSVYLAERLNSDFKQKVALKLIKRGMDSEAILKRFAMERRILSSLKHPNIAQLIDGGISDEGTSYFAMEYVEGTPLNQFCRDNNVSLEERLQIFQQVCSAVDHAHKNLIIHRDLKPTNILVTSDRVPKLLDFGIAKLFSGDDSATTITATKGKMFTPEYASPEQIVGGNITTASDVYSLGVVLFELLVQHRPFDVKGKSYEEIVKNICETEPPRPSETGGDQGATTEAESNSFQIPKSQLRGDLDNITLKALSKEPVERYGSVQQFSDDISLYLDGRPIIARPHTARYRFGKYFKRHKVGVLAAALVLFSILTGFSIATWQAIVAKRERAKAEARFDDVRKLANTILFDYYDGLEKLPGSTLLRNQMVTNAVEYLDKLAAEASQDRDLQMELADAYKKIGDIQGGLDKASLGQREAAIESYRKALSIMENLVGQEPENPLFRSKLAAGFSTMREMYWIEVKLDDALDMQTKAYEISKNLAAEFPENNEYRALVGIHEVFLGRVLGASNRLDESLEHSLNGVKLLEAASTAEPGNLKILKDLSGSYDVVSELYAQFNSNLAEALRYAEKGQATAIQILEADLTLPTNRRSVAIGYYNFAVLNEQVGSNRIALENGKKALAMFTDLLNEDKQNEDYKQIVAASEIVVAGLLIKTGNAREAIESSKNSLAALEKLKTASPNDEIVEWRLANVRESLGKAYFALAFDAKSGRLIGQGNLLTACQYLQKSHETYKRFKDTGKTVGKDAAKADELADATAKCAATLGER